ncbi:Detected protein of unknown function [Hibiscus syriacus]|uniref:PMI1/PMIR1-2 C-terminal domain-containing protein n=1 Tax=Hibiscus syriacus TaxID=106335 RepID=A0A6A2Z997_HIBSY|nr:Detected protein of unknown function [Hibiscus syriacus]
MLTITCSISGTKGRSHNSVKYEAMHCSLYASVFGAPGLDLEKHRVDLTWFLPLSWEELEEEKSSGNWATSFKLSGKARGAVMNVSYGYTVLSDMKQSRKTGTKLGNDDQKSTMRDVESLPCLPNTTSLSLLMEEMKEPILPASKLDTDDANVVDKKFDEYKSDDALVASKLEPDVLVEHFEPTLPPSSDASELNESEEGSMVAVVSKEGRDMFVVQDCSSKVCDQVSKESLMRELELALDDAVQEHRMETNGRIKVRAKVLEDLEKEALMHDWGLNENAAPPRFSVGLGNLQDFHCRDSSPSWRWFRSEEEPLDLSPLGDGLGPLLQTKNIGFLRSMNPSLFRNPKIGGSLIMQMSSPVVLPAEMGPSVMDVLQRLASIGIEKLSMQANKLMPLEDITGKTMQQVAWEDASTLEGSQSQYLLQHDSEVGEKKIERSPVSRSSKLSSSSVNEMSSDIWVTS